MPTSITGQGISIYPAPDDALSSTSKNPVQNKVIDEELSDVKNALSALEDACDYAPLEININKSIVTATGVNILPSSIQSENGFCCVCVPCTAGNIFTITGSGGSQTRLWAFSDSNGDILTGAGSNVSATKLILTAPQNAAYFAYNSRTNVDYDVYKGRKPKDVMAEKADKTVATTSANGLMSAEDKTKLDIVYADYSSALTALGVI